MSSAVNDALLQRVRELAALELWRRGAIAINVNEPYTLVSGRSSPIYVNCRRAISYPSSMDLFVYGARLLIESENISFDLIAGGETAGIPFAAYLARALDRPLVYVRKQPKGHGSHGRVEGVVGGGERALLVEDLITDAGSKLAFISGLSENHAVVSDVLVLFDRGEGGKESLASRGITLHSVTHLHLALEMARDTSLVSVADIEAVQAYLRLVSSEK